MRRLEVTLVHPAAGDLGFVDNLTVQGQRVWGVGGHGTPTLLHSHDGGRSFARWAAPEGCPGLRDAHAEGDMLWLVGEDGLITRTPIADTPVWNPLVRDEICTWWTIVRDHKGRLLIPGDDGILLRSRGERFHAVKTQSVGKIFNVFAEPTSVWLMDSVGMLQRSTGKAFMEVPLKAMRTDRPLTAMARTPAQTLLLVGDHGLVLRSKTNGVTWKKIPIDSRVHVEDILVTRYGILIAGGDGSFLISHDDGQSFQGLATDFEQHLWAIAECDGDYLVSGDNGRVWRIDRAELALVMRDAYADRDPVIAALAARVHERDEGAELVLEDAMRERGLW